MSVKYTPLFTCLHARRWFMCSQSWRRSVAIRLPMCQSSSMRRPSLCLRSRRFSFATSQCALGRKLAVLRYCVSINRPPPRSLWSTSKELDPRHEPPASTQDFNLDRALFHPLPVSLFFPPSSLPLPSFPLVPNSQVSPKIHHGGPGTAASAPSGSGRSPAENCIIAWC